MKIHVDETELKFFIQNEVMKQLRNSQVASKGYVCSEIQDRMRQHSQGYDHQKMREERGEISPNARSMINILMENQRKRDARLRTVEKQVKKLFAEIGEINKESRILFHEGNDQKRFEALADLVKTVIGINEELIELSTNNANDMEGVEGMVGEILTQITEITKKLPEITGYEPLPKEDTSYNDVIFRYLDEIRKLLDTPGQTRGAMEIKIHRKIIELKNYLDGGRRYNK